MDCERRHRKRQAVPPSFPFVATRNDIFTADALAWAYFQTDQIEKAKSMIALALRTGMRDATIRTHEAAIQRATVNAHQVARR